MFEGQDWANTMLLLDMWDYDEVGSLASGLANLIKVGLSRSPLPSACQPNCPDRTVLVNYAITPRRTSICQFLSALCRSKG